MLLFREYREHREQFRFLDDFEQAMSRMQGSVNRALEETRNPLKTIAQRLFDAAKNGFFLIQVCEWKIHYLADALLHAIESRNPLSLANNTRALIEHLAALVFVVQSLDQLRDSLDGQGNEDKINQAITKIEGILNRAYYGKSPKKTGKEEAAPHVESECLAALEKQIPDVREIYDFLCEYVHPNHGSNLLVSTGQLGKGRLNPPPEFHRTTIEQICGYCSSAMLFLADATIHISATLMTIKDLVDRCSSKGATVGNVFARRGTIPEGDGQSKETAFFFPKARTAVEAIDMTRRYLKDSGIRLTGNRENVGVSEGFVYDVYPSSRGRLWFKIPIVTL
jgi:hypothetical protein